MAEKIRAVLIDDEHKGLKVMEKLLSTHKEIDVVGKVDDTDKVLQSIIKNKPELVFLDIQMPQKDGFEILHELQNLSFTPKVIFTTAYDQYAVKAFCEEVVDYLLKPIDLEELYKAIEKYKKYKANTYQKQTQPIHTQDSKIKFYSCDGIVFYNKEEILYAEAEKNYSFLYATRNRTEHLTMNLGKLEKMLASPPFYRISRSIIINTNYLRKVNRKRQECILEYKGELFKFHIPQKKIKDLNNFL
jgi:two-component system LytT family response regulator